MSTQYLIESTGNVLVAMQATAYANLRNTIKVAHDDDVMADASIRKKFIQASVANLLMFPLMDITDALFKGSTKFNVAIKNFEGSVWENIDPSLNQSVVHEKIGRLLYGPMYATAGCKTMIRCEDPSFLMLKNGLMDRREISLASLVFSGTNCRPGQEHIWYEFHAAFIDPKITAPKHLYPEPVFNIPRGCRGHWDYSTQQVYSFYYDLFGFSNGIPFNTPEKRRVFCASPSSPQRGSKKRSASASTSRGSKKRRLVDTSPLTLHATPPAPPAVPAPPAPPVEPVAPAMPATPAMPEMPVIQAASAPSSPLFKPLSRDISPLLVPVARAPEIEALCVARAPEINVVTSRPGSPVSLSSSLVSGLFSGWSSRPGTRAGSPALFFSLSVSRAGTPAPLFSNQVSRAGTPAPLFSNPVSRAGTPAPLFSNPVSRAPTPAPPFSNPVSRAASPAPFFSEPLDDVCHPGSRAASPAPFFSDVPQIPPMGQDLFLYVTNAFAS